MVITNLSAATGIAMAAALATVPPAAAGSSGPSRKGSSGPGNLKPTSTNEKSSASFRRRTARTRDHLLDEAEGTYPYLEVQKRMLRDEGKQVLIDVERLIAQSSNKYGLAIQIAEEATEYLRNNKEAALTRKPVLKAISDRINDGAGELVTDSYLDTVEDYSKYQNLLEEESKEK
eukprot:TRINITY_DN26797_c0_g1_i1.p1 TRINITY_DN26797_c0_g1~~TRINITY_DN26797_c0_g1_i1.p1  ORF type:complete len:175 (-),score=29.91 TRINITY_DN26797_c0_g1_i1:466-990(-)